MRPHPSDQLGKPTFRAIISARRLTLVSWDEVPFSVAAAHEAISQRPPANVVVAELSVDFKAASRELVVSPLTGLTEEAEQVLVRWAATVGYRRVWFPRRAVELRGALTAIGRASVHCATCGMRWHKESADFWAGVWARGSFPMRCELCAAVLPQWDVDPRSVNDGLSIQPGSSDETREG